MDLNEVIRERRSIRKYKSDSVDDLVLKELLEAARLAPSWSNQQCWRFVVVKEAARKKALAESMPDNNPAKKAVGESAPVVIVLCADPEQSGRLDGKEYYLLDAGLAMQQFMLSAWERDLGTCWVAWFDEEKAREACGIPANFRVVALSPFGYPEKLPSERPRKELSEIAFSEIWGKPLSEDK